MYTNNLSWGATFCVVNKHECNIVEKRKKNGISEHKLGYDDESTERI